MQVATAETVQPQPGEAAFILQLRPPARGDADTLAAKLERFTGLFLGRAEGESVRFASLGGLSWMIAAPPDSVEAVDAACDALAEMLFGDPASEAVQLTRQPDGEPEVEPTELADAAAGEGDWALAGDGDGQPAFDAVSELGAANAVFDEPAADSEPADSTSEDDWALAEPSEPERIEPDVMASEAIDDGQAGGGDWTLESGGDNAIDLDALSPATNDVGEEPEPSVAPLDLAAELGAFRAEMKRIAEAIPGAGGDTALAEFRASLESISGELGQRVDGAAQRIEAAAEQVSASVDAGRLEAAGARVEKAAELIETSVRDALTALTGAGAAMGGARAESGPAGEAAG